MAHQRLIASLTAVCLGFSPVAALWAQAARDAASPAPGARGNPALPALGESVARELSPAAERAMGDRAMREIWRDPDVIDDPVLLEYVQGIWSALLKSSRERGELTADLDGVYAWRPFLIRDPVVNAFAMPGGYMGVFLGLIALTESRDELASVLAHELSHVTQRHIARMVSAAPKFSAISLAAMVLGALAASRNPQAGEAIMMGGQAAAASGQLSFSRDMEREADRIGLSVLIGAGFSPAGMARMFEKLEQASRLNDDNNFPFLRDHPLTTERIGEARERLGPAAFQVRSPPDHLHLLMQARAQVLMDRRSIHLQQIISQDKALGASSPERAWGASPLTSTTKTGDYLLAGSDEPLAKAYAVALAATQLRRWEVADHALAWAQERIAGLPAGDAPATRRQFELLSVESMLERGDEARAKDGLARLQGDPSRPVLIAMSRWALMPGHDRAVWQASAANLEDQVSRQPQDATSWGLLAQTWQRLNQPLRAIRAEAEAHAALGDEAGAIDRLRAGQRLARQSKNVDAIEAAVIDSRLRHLEVALRAEQKESAPHP